MTPCEFTKDSTSNGINEERSGFKKASIPAVFEDQKCDMQRNLKKNI